MTDKKELGALHHGGGLLKAAEFYGILETDWIDLSTGISPWGYPVATMPAEVWQRLPESDDALLSVAAHYYHCNDLLAVAGSQAAIMALPILLKNTQNSGQVALPKVGYKEHEAAWRSAGWQISYYDLEPSESQLNEVDLLLVISPNNPQGQHYSAKRLLDWHQQLNNRGSTLLVDEAFMDCTPGLSLLNSGDGSFVMPSGLIILRSVGKFFGLAGIRLGFVFAESALLSQLEQLLGPWNVSHPARWVGQCALKDELWQAEQQQKVKQASKNLKDLLYQHFSIYSVGCDLFQTLYYQQAIELHQHLCRQGILSRLTDEQDAVRFGLPSDNYQWQRLQKALVAFC